MESKNSLQFTTIENQIKAALMPIFRSENVSIDLNLADGKFIDLIRINKDDMLEVRPEALEVRFLSIVFQLL